MKKYKKADVESFLVESNAIEGVYSKAALEDAQKAWKYLMAVEGDLTMPDILKTHELLAKRINPEIAGKIRECTVYIGGQIKPFISHKLILDDLETFCEEVNLTIKIDPDKKEECCKSSHVFFENIHPFNDFNGRTGRCLLNWQRWRMGLPILIVKEGEDQMEYYSWFRQ